MGDRYVVATRQHGPKETRYVVVRVQGAVIKDSTIDPKHVVQEFENPSEAEALAARLNAEPSN
jgi:hypothetical protein